MMASSQQSYFLSQQQQQQQQQQPVYTNSPVDEAAAIGLSSHVSPSILLIIVILAVVFFVSGLLHLLVRFLLRPPTNSRRRDALSDRDGGATALQGQLRQLFHLHDAGVDQTFIDALPVFLYKAVIGAAKSAHLDCAVCLCEFEPEDRLRLLPLCSHAFHVDCIDTWLLSHSTCPLCRASLLVPSGVSIRRSPLLLVLESAAAESAPEQTASDPIAGESVVTVKLGKFKTTGEGTSTAASTSSDIGVDSRRCFSMGSFAYVVDESSELRVPIRTPAKKTTESKKRVAKPVFRTAISECDCESKREFEFGDLPKPVSAVESGEIGRSSVGRSRRAFSFRFLRSHESGDQDQPAKGRFPRRTVSEIGVGRRENGTSEVVRFGGEEESEQSFNSLDSQTNPQSFARKTLLWLMGKQQNKVGDSSLDPPDNNV